MFRRIIPHVVSSTLLSERFRGSERAGAVEIEQFDGKADSIALTLICVFLKLAEIYRSDRVSIL